MSKILKSKYGTYLTEQEIKYREELAAYQFNCPIIHKMLKADDGEIIFSGGQDWLISNEGIDKLIGIFGEKFILERMITYD